MALFRSIFNPLLPLIATLIPVSLSLLLVSACLADVHYIAIETFYFNLYIRSNASPSMMILPSMLAPEGGFEMPKFVSYIVDASADLLTFCTTYSRDSDYAGANLDRKSTTGGCQFLGRRLISWQCKKQTIVATSTTEVEYVAAASCCGNQLYHSKTKHIAIRHHFIRDAYEKKLIQVLKIYTDDNVADLLTKRFDRVSWVIEEELLMVLKPPDTTFTMDVLDSCPKHNMVAYLEKSEGNAEFHEIIDFLKRSSIHHALTWKSVSISEESIKIGSSFDDDVGIESFLIWAIFVAIQDNGDEGASSDRPSEAHPTPSPAPTSELPHEPQTDSSPAQTSEVQRDPLFDAIPEDAVDHMETENAQDEGRTREMVDEDKEIDENILSTEDVLSTDKEGVSTDRPIVSTDGSKVSTDRQNEDTEENFKGTEEHNEGTEEQIESTNGQRKAKVLLNMSQAKAVSREKEKGVELKDIEETDRPRPTSTRSLLTLKPLLKIDPKDKGKKKIEEGDESESESDGIPEAEKKFKQLETDEEMARKIQEEEQFTIEERAKFLHDTIAAQRIFLAQQRSEAIRNRPPTKNQLRNQMMTYLKHVGNFKHVELKIKKFEEVQALYEKIKRSDEDFNSIGSAEDERLIKRMNEKGVDSSKSEVIKEESKEQVQMDSKEEESTRKRKLGTRKKMKSTKRRYIQNTSEDDSDKENDELELHLL
ncbi:putative ribonuclease H-like domain-containing protein [Tanacetum coccineum]